MIPPPLGQQATTERETSRDVAARRWPNEARAALYSEDGTR